MKSVSGQTQSSVLGFFVSCDKDEMPLLSAAMALSDSSRRLAFPRWRVVFFGLIFQKTVKTAVPDAGNPPGALVLTKLVE